MTKGNFTMNYRPLGQTGLQVSTLGFGCGAIGGLLVRGDYPAMRQTVARAIELGVNYFDTASLYGNGQSEVNLGAVLRELGVDVLVGTKARLTRSEELAQIEQTITQSVEGSLRRLGREVIDLIQFHNSLGAERNLARSLVTAADLEVVITAFQKLQQQGKIRHWGITGLGETGTLQQVVTNSNIQSVQCCYNLLNPSAGMSVATDFPFQNYGQIINSAATRQIGVIAIRVLAGGALSGVLERHPVAAREVNPIASSPEYADDVAQAQRLVWLIDEGHVTTLVEAAIRFVISNPAVSTALVGVSTLEQLEQAIAYADRGALPAAVLARLLSM
jgi:L-galactose dehydrogenase/L-glyceraldehyde 3-phosphate reductase